MPDVIRRLSYHISDAGLIAMTSWPTLNDSRPEIGQKCNWAVIHNDWCSFGCGVWLIAFVGADGKKFGFTDYRGAMISDPAITYWSPATL